MSIEYTNILSRLSKEGIDYVVIGGVAAALHGSTYHTLDIDICFDFSPSNLLKLQKALRDIHPVHRMTPGRIPLQLTQDNCRDIKNLYLDTDLGQLDCIGFVQGIGDFKEVKKNSQRMKMQDYFVQVLNATAVIEAKKSLNRDHDREAIRQLEIIQKMQNKKTNKEFKNG
jgi:hypothetical protein